MAELAMLVGTALGCSTGTTMLIVVDDKYCIGDPLTRYSAPSPPVHFTDCKAQSPEISRLLSMYIVEEQEPYEMRWFEGTRYRLLRRAYERKKSAIERYKGFDRFDYAERLRFARACFPQLPAECNNPKACRTITMPDMYFPTLQLGKYVYFVPTEHYVQGGLNAFCRLHETGHVERMGELLGAGGGIFAPPDARYILIRSGGTRIEVFDAIERKRTRILEAHSVVGQLNDHQSLILGEQGGLSLFDHKNQDLRELARLPAEWLVFGFAQSASNRRQLWDVVASSRKLNLVVLRGRIRSRDQTQAAFFTFVFDRSGNLADSRARAVQSREDALHGPVVLDDDPLELAGVPPTFRGATP